MKNIIIILLVLFFTSCKTKKEVYEKVSTKKVEVEYVESKKVINNRVISQKPIISYNEIDLNKFDLYKELFSKNSPLVTIDSVTNTIIETYIGLDNILRQRIKTKPEDINVSDSTTIVNKNSSSIIEKDSTHNELQVVQQPNVKVGLFSKIWSFIKNSLVFILIIAGIALFLYIRKFNILSLVKKLFK